MECVQKVLSPTAKKSLVEKTKCREAAQTHLEFRQEINNFVLLPAMLLAFENQQMKALYGVQNFTVKLF